MLIILEKHEFPTNKIANAPDGINNQCTVTIVHNDSPNNSNM